MSNLEIAKLFRNIAASYAIKNEKKYHFQIVAYQNASDLVSNMTSELEELYKEKKLDSLPGIGVTIKSRLEELFKKGHVKYFDHVLKGIPQAVFTLIEIPSIGPKKAFKLSKHFSLKNSSTAIGELINKAKEGKIAKLPNFGEKSQSDILQALLEYRQGKTKLKRMVLPYAGDLAEKILSHLRTSKAVIKAVTLGSLRRMKETVGDVDIAVASDQPQDAINHFVSYPYKERIIEKGPSTASILVSGGKQIDLMVQGLKSFGSLLQHFTGSKSHNVHLRSYALKKGMSLSERGIKDVKSQKMRYFETEEAFYEALGMSWIPPEIREDTGEIELAIKHNLPKLVELEDIKGDLHIHSNFPIEPSHDLGQDSISDMANQAAKLKYEYIGFSEHNPSISKHTDGEIYSMIARRNDNIEQIKSSIKSVRIIKLLEIDILANGKLAIDNKSLELLDGAIVSIHSSFGMNKDEMTKRVINGLSHPKAKILAHPTGRLINERSGYNLDFDKLFDFCKKNNKALEINSWPTRLDLPDLIVREAINNSVKLVIDTDSHALWQMNLMKYGVAIAKRGWAKKSDIMNTRGYEEFVKWLKN